MTRRLRAAASPEVTVTVLGQDPGARATRQELLGVDALHLGHDCLDDRIQALLWAAQIRGVARGET